ncbi:uncharacterized protein F4807DRAFT_452905 [Annulohypoxylon truncatum]|uniref:uncharacterized protein n=1 Tax=Annulohypoxylon truncatum TaxID=327061 RepID=UPI002008AE1A|nr:uncharacterized protein F4807DRAFT_452905 [Annulohypoxylon truncatum]KAI1207302.1 hypothetical protein F4807DRAFT_452905 [Annulohypoxylon truncatum]
MRFYQHCQTVGVFNQIGGVRRISSIGTGSLQQLLSPDSYIGNSAAAPRWSNCKEPQPGAVVHPASEKDVQVTVKWAVDNNIPFFVQNGGNGWATTFTIDDNGIAVDIDLLRDVTFSGDKNLFIVGGIGSLTGEYGLRVDNIMSMNVVLADGSSEVITLESSPDLFWALRGAGPNFGVVTLAVLKAHPVNSNKSSTAWTGALIYTPTQLDSGLGAIASLTIEATNVTLHDLDLGNTGQPSIVVSVFYHGTEDAGRAALASLLSVGPVSDGIATSSYETWNVGSICAKGGRKPTWAVGMSRLDPTSWHAVYDVWKELVGQAGFEHSSVLLNINAMEKARELPVSSSVFPFRQTVSLFASITALHTDPALDATALSYGQKARELWQSADGLAQHST